MADFDSFISKIREMQMGGDSADEKDIADQIASSLKKQWDTPPTTELEITLQRNLVDDQVRQMLFFPGPLHLTESRGCQYARGGKEEIAPLPSPRQCTARKTPSPVPAFLSGAVVCLANGNSFIAHQARRTLSCTPSCWRSHRRAPPRIIRRGACSPPRSRSSTSSMPSRCAAARLLLLRAEAAPAMLLIAPRRSL